MHLGTGCIAAGMATTLGTGNLESKIAQCINLLSSSILPYKPFKISRISLPSVL